MRNAKEKVRERNMSTKSDTRVEEVQEGPNYATREGGIGGDAIAVSHFLRKKE